MSICLMSTAICNNRRRTCNNSVFIKNCDSNYIVSCHDYYKLRDGTIWLDISKNNFTGG